MLGLIVRETNGYHGPPQIYILEVFMVNNLVFRWPKPLFFMVLGAHGNNGLIRSYSLIGETTQEWNDTLFYSEKKCWERW